MRRAGLGTRFVIGSLTVWRLTHLIAEEDGPADVVLKVHERLGSSRLGDLMDCFACISVWVAVPVSVAVADRRRDLPVVWLALSGSACLLERAAKLAEADCFEESRAPDTVQGGGLAGLAPA